MAAMDEQMNITIKDVARHANVSVATVSRALNGHENVADAVRKRVAAVADQLQYTPHHAARSLSSRRTHTIGVVLPDLQGEFFSELMRGIDQVARERRLHLLVSSCHDKQDEQDAALRAMRGRVDGLLVMSPCVDDGTHFGGSLSESMPTVIMNSRVPDGEHHLLCIDNYGGARAMVRHLVGSGYRKICFIAGPRGNFDASERLRGYRDEMAQSVPDVQPWILHGNFDEVSGHQAGESLLTSTWRPEAVFAANDMMALGCMFALNKAGLQAPHDLAIAGFDDIPLSRFAYPSLTTMRVDIAKLGERAMRLLLEATLPQNHASKPINIPLQPQLMVRDSTAERIVERAYRVSS